MYYPRVLSFCRSLLRWKGRRKQLGQRLLVDDDKEGQVRVKRGKVRLEVRRDDYIITHALSQFRSFPALFIPADAVVGAAAHWTVTRAL